MEYRIYVYTNGNLAKGRFRKSFISENAAIQAITLEIARKASKAKSIKDINTEQYVITEYSGPYKSKIISII